MAAVDPGGRWTGFVVRDRGDQLLFHGVITREPGETPPAYISTAAVLITGALERYRPVMLAAEDLVDPTPQMGVTAVAGLLGTSRMIGHLEALFPDLVLVRPGGHGSQPLELYPPALVGARERSGEGILRHARSAWDVAGEAIRYRRHPQLAWRPSA